MDTSIIDPQIFAGLPAMEQTKVRYNYAVPFIRKAIIATVEVTGISEKSIKSKTRRAEVTAARQILMHIARKHRKVSYQLLGDIFNRDHSTVIYSVREAENRLQNDKTFRQLYSRVMNRFTNQSK